MKLRSFLLTPATVALFACSCACAAQAAQHAHVHGHIQLGIAIDGPTVTVDIDTPLESLLGFEHAPGTAQEKALAARWKQLIAKGTGLVSFNAQAACTLKQVDMDAPPIGLGTPTASKQDGHADLEGNWVFQCANPQALSQAHVGFFEQSPHAQQVEVRLITGKGQSKTVLKRPQASILLTR